MGIDATMLLRVKGAPSDEDLKKWSWDLCNIVGADKFMLNREQGTSAITLSSTYNDEDEPLVAPGRAWVQDGPTLYANEDETFLEVHLWTRYYGVGYERGDLDTICNTAEWCERNIPNCEVWYGGDSSGIEVEPFPAEARNALKAHLLSPKGRDYFNRFSTW